MCCKARLFVSLPYFHVEWKPSQASFLPFRSQGFSLFSNPCDWFPFLFCVRSKFVMAACFRRDYGNLKRNGWVEKIAEGVFPFPKTRIRWKSFSKFLLPRPPPLLLPPPLYIYQFLFCCLNHRKDSSVFYLILYFCCTTLVFTFFQLSNKWPFLFPRAFLLSALEVFYSFSSVCFFFYTFSATWTIFLRFNAIYLKYRIPFFLISDFPCLSFIHHFELLFSFQCFY